MGFSQVTVRAKVWRMKDLEHNPVHLELSNEAGGYYCEHAFFLGTLAARAAGSVGTDFAGDPTIGFLHVPDDRPLPGAGRVVSESAADRRTLQLVSHVVRTWTPTNPGAGPFLLTGFGPFADVHDNPSQRAARSASAPDGSPMERLILDVDDHGLRTLCQAIAQLRPCAVLMMGVRRGTPNRYAAETVATDRNLQWSLRGTDCRAQHHDQLAATMTLRPNPALHRALLHFSTASAQLAPSPTGSNAS